MEIDMKLQLCLEEFNMSTNKEKVALFQVEKEGRFLFKKYHHTIAVYDDGISIDEGQKLFIPLKNMNPYIDDGIISNYDEKNRFIQIPYLDNNGAYCEYRIDESTYPGICEKMEKVLMNEWSILRTRYPETVRWFMGCVAIFYISSEENPFIYGTPFPEIFYENTAEVTQIYKTSLKATLAEQWEIYDRESLLERLDKLYDGETVKQFNDDYQNADRGGMVKWQIQRFEDINARGEKSIWAWDLQRMIMLCSGGYVCGDMEYEESLDLCLKAGEKLQGIYDSWDDFMESYFLGVAQWQDEAVGGAFTENENRKIRYEAMKRHKLTPWEISWKHPLKKEW
jgi:hypothetical protein